MATFLCLLYLLAFLGGGEAWSQRSSPVARARSLLAVTCGTNSNCLKRAPDNKNPTKFVDSVVAAGCQWLPTPTFVCDNGGPYPVDVTNCFNKTTPISYIAIGVNGGPCTQYTAAAGNKIVTLSLKCNDTVNIYGHDGSFQGDGFDNVTPRPACLSNDAGNCALCTYNVKYDCTGKLMNDVCRVKNGTCDVEEKCTGTSATCPDDGFAGTNVECRAKNGTCDVAENCSGTSATCPDDGFAGTNVECRAKNGTCDVEEKCTGTSATCPDDGFAGTNVECRPSVGQCDAPEYCTGDAPTCTRPNLCKSYPDVVIDSTHPYVSDCKDCPKVCPAVL